MKFEYALIKTAVCAAIILALGPAGAMAQGRAHEGAGRADLKIRELTGIGPRSLIRSPDAGSSKRSSSREWAELTIQYDTEAEWTDEVSFQFYVLLKSRNGTEYTLLKGVVTYVDVERGRAHQGVAFVRPAALARFGEITGVAVEAVVKGEVKSVLSDGRLAANKPLPSDWWKNPKFTPKEGYIVDKSKTPFILVNFDSYEALK